MTQDKDVKMRGQERIVTQTFLEKLSESCGELPPIPSPRHTTQS